MDFSSIFKVSYPKFRAYAYTLTQDISKAEDLVMEVIRKLIEKQSSAPKDVNPESYIIRSIKNQFIDTLRKDKNLSPLDTTLEQSLADEYSGKEITGQSNLDILVKNLATLGENCSNVLSLFGLGHSYQEIAEIENITTGTVMSRMSRCREKLLYLYRGHSNDH